MSMTGTPIPSSLSTLATEGGKVDTATDAFIEQALPSWLKQASPARINALRDRFAAYQTTQENLRLAKVHLTPPDAFARTLLQRELQGQLSLSIDLRRAQWLEVRRRFTVHPGGELPTDEIKYVGGPALPRLMQNFQKGLSFYQGSGLVLDDTQSTLLTDRLEEIAELCRSTDAGGRFQVLLSRIFNVATQAQLAADKRCALGVEAEIAALKGQLSEADLQMLRRLVDEHALVHAQSLNIRPVLLTLLGCPIDGALAFELLSATEEVRSVMLYLPGDPGQPLRHFSSWSALGDGLATALKQHDYLAYFIRLVGLKDRHAFLLTLAKRLSDTRPDLQPRGRAAPEEIFVSLAAQQVKRIKDDARFILVPTAEADTAAAQARLDNLEELGLGVLNLAGLFIPSIGLLLFGQMVGETLLEVYEGAADWALGHQYEAIEHMLGVAETVAVTAALVGGVAVASRGFARSAFVDELEPIELESQDRRLWANDLTPYRVLPEPQNTQVLENGLHSDGERYWWRHAGAYYEVQPSAEETAWRLRHPERPNGFGPRLEFNGERAWRVQSERPLEWEGNAVLLGRLWPSAARFDLPDIEAIVKVAGCNEAQLRGLLVENRPLPVSLRDTLERFSVAARIDVFFAQLDAGTASLQDHAFLDWCAQQLATTPPSDAALRLALLDQPSLWREQLLEHFAQQYLADDVLLPLLKRDFPSLPDAYALNVLRQASEMQRQRMLAESRIPLALAEQARLQLQSATLTRTLEGLYLDDSYRPETVELVFAWLRRREGWPQAINLELRKGSDTGPRLARLYAQDPSAELKLLVRREGAYCLYDEHGRELAESIAAPAGLFEALVAALPAADRARLGWDGPLAGQQMRREVQQWLPATRQELIRLIGLREIKPRFNPGQRLPDGRVGYQLSGRGRGGAPALNILRDRVRGLYPSFSEQQISTYLEILHAAPGSPFVNLLNQEQSYVRFDLALSRWETEIPHSVQRNRRRFICEELRRCWRLQGEILYSANGENIGMRLDLSGVEADNLPALPENTDFSHVVELDLSNMRLQQVPASFLHCFVRVRRLSLHNNALQSIPTALSHLTDLHRLHITQNRIRMTAPGAITIASLRQLRVLNLSHNPLGLISLQLRNLTQLTELYLRNCLLSTVPAGLVSRGFLHVADLRGNQISTLPHVLLNAHADFRHVVLLEGNPLPVAVREQMGVAVFAPVDLPERAPGRARSRWLERLDGQEQRRRGEQWDRLRAEADSAEFFDIIDQLVETSDFRLAREDLERRVWEVFDAASEDSELRNELFDLATNPRTCVDSVSVCFSALEVRVFMARAMQRSEPGQARQVRLNLARRLFRLERLEQFARDDIAARRAAGQEVDEIEVSLAYRVGLAQSLDLPGQPRTMQFRVIADVTQQRLEEAANRVRHAEDSPALANFISQRDFWREHLRQAHPARFESEEQVFWERLEALTAQQDSLMESDYLERINQLSRERQTALDALFQRLTEEALAAERAGEG